MICRFVLKLSSRIIPDSFRRNSLFDKILDENWIKSQWVFHHGDQGQRDKDLLGSENVMDWIDQDVRCEDDDGNQDWSQLHQHFTTDCTELD